MLTRFLSVCEEAAREGGRVLRQWSTRFTVREKGPSDLVTEADSASQEAIRNILLRAFPRHGFIGEEEGQRIGGEYVWIVDPLDGTTNYVHGVPQYAVSIALARGEELLVGAVFDPIAGECYLASQGSGTFLNGKRIHVSKVQTASQALVAVSFPAKVARGSPELAAFSEAIVACQAVRRYGSAALNLAYIAAGRFDAYWATETKPWDVAAGYLLVQEAGGVVRGLDGSAARLEPARFLATSTMELQNELRTILHPIARSVSKT